MISPEYDPAIAMPESAPKYPAEPEYNNPELGIPVNEYQLYGNREDFKGKMRMGFIRKVYGILCFQLIITTVFVTIATVNRDFAFFIYSHPSLIYLTMFVSLVILLGLLCFPMLFRKVPVNYILLTVWTLCESYLVSAIAAFNPPEIVLTAAIFTTGVTLALTFYACVTKTDFTILGGLLFVGVMILLIWGILISIFGFFLYTLYCVLGVILFSVYLIFDTQLVLGKFQYEYSVDDYILAALNIYIDIIQMFVYLLQILRRN